MITGFVVDDKYIWNADFSRLEREILASIGRNHVDYGDVSYKDIEPKIEIDLDAVKQFAETNFADESDSYFAVTANGYDVTNPWMDMSARFELSDAGAVKEWGLDTVIKFVLGATKLINGKEVM